MKVSLQLKMRQGLTMTQQLSQAIRLLQLSNLELQGEIQDLLESNMMLELDDDGVENNDTTTPLNDKTTTAEEPAQEPAQEIKESILHDDVWDSTYDTGGSFDKNYNETGAREYYGANEKTLKEHLLSQLDLNSVHDDDKAMAMAIIYALDDDGYLSCDLEDVLAILQDEQPELKMANVVAMLHLVQSFDPIGVGARDLRECLLIQLDQCKASSWLQAKAKQLVDTHLQLLAAYNYDKLARVMKITKDELEQIVILIQSMNPKPGSEINAGKTEYVVPDVYVKKNNNEWLVELNADAFQKLKINGYYASIIKQRANNDKDAISLKSHLQEARWFIKSLHSRSDTLLNVAKCIVKRQIDFLQYGDIAMKPMILKDVAEELELHESTVSRITTKKYIHTPRGIFELKYFFSSQLNFHNSVGHSSTAIRAFIKEMIQSENKKQPLRDSEISSLLSQQGVSVARRTVAKYRESMTIPSWNKRKLELISQ